MNFIEALGHTESNDNPNAPLGDHGRALGRFQVHPDWVWSVATKFGLQPKLDETWDSFVTRLVTRFHEHWIVDLPAIEVAMFFHIGHKVKVGEKDWDGPYAERFMSFYTGARI